ncbi:hypothetical protein [Cyanobium sp. NIES-981]|uniref:hypothetical protein n=1 Tax=Cyanobium sp. NIES-981 TaxID=1851505 RepID=UPI0007DD38F9|nr:hypothetical protein [Cyanobium sp. NIES-981]SBO41825.1 conserved protein of unknown function [Cyanobium sp. NIES-981]
MPGAPLHRPLLAVLAVPAVLAVIQQQLLLRLPPRLEGLGNAPASSGPAALQARFSRPMDPASLQSGSRLDPPLAHRWLGSGDSLLLSLAEGQTLRQPLQLDLAGKDRRGLALAASRWLWDPRPRLLAVVSQTGGEQLQIRDHDGRWRPISPVWPAIPVAVPLGDGSGVAAASRDPSGQLRLWTIGLRQRNLAPLARGLGAIQIAPPQPLGPAAVTFAHLSSNRRGELLVQSGSLEEAGSTAMLVRPRSDGRPQGQGSRLPWQASGPMLLLPGGGSVVVPDPDGLHLETLPPRQPRRQTLPGSRDLSSFCPQAGRAVLLRHWPDFRRSLELVEPGRAPQQLWLGTQAVVASACSRGGERVWALLVEGRGAPELSMLVLDRRGRTLARRRLDGWELEPGTGLHYDPSSEQLLVALRPLGAIDARPAPAQPVLIDAVSLELRSLARAVSQVHWLPAG